MIKGIDVSHYQAGIDWKAVAAAGYKFAYAKCTDGLGSDPTFQSFRQQAKAERLLFGGYHFFRFDIDPQLQAQKAFHSSAGVAHGELPFFLDVEWDHQSQKYGDSSVMDDAAMDAVATCCNEMIRLMKSVGIYTNFYFWNGDAASERGFPQLPLWVPNYSAKDISQVKIPAPWKTATIWQNSESLNIGGATRVDENMFLGSDEELKALVQA